MLAKGRCFCGEIEFSITLPCNWVVHCHCKICQKTHGAAFVTWVSAKEESFDFVDHNNNLVWFNSSKEGKRSFCKKCGSNLFFKSPKFPNEVHIPLASFDSNIDQQPQAHYFVNTQVDWCQINDGLPKK